MKQSQDFKVKLRLPAFLKAPFLRRKKSKIGPVSSDDFSQNGNSPVDGMPRPGGDVDDDGASVRQLEYGASNTEASNQGLPRRSSKLVQDLDAPAKSPSPSPTNKSFHRLSMSKLTSTTGTTNITTSQSGGGENVRVSMTVDTIKQQVNDGIQLLAEFRKSLRPSCSDVELRRYNEAMGTLENVAKDLTSLKNKLSSRKLQGGDGGGRNSCVIPPPESLKLEIEEIPFSCGIPGMSMSEETKTNQSQSYTTSSSPATTTPTTSPTPTMTTFTATSPLTSIKENEKERDGERSDMLESVREYSEENESGNEIVADFKFPGGEEESKVEGLPVAMAI